MPLLREPAAKLRTLGGLKATIGLNMRKDGSMAFAVQFNRTYRDQDGEFHDTNSFDVGQVLQISVLATDACIPELRAEDKEAIKPGPESES